MRETRLNDIDLLKPSRTPTDPQSYDDCLSNESFKPVKTDIPILPRALTPTDLISSLQSSILGSVP